MPLPKTLRVQGWTDRAEILVSAHLVVGSEVKMRRVRLLRLYSTPDGEMVALELGVLTKPELTGELEMG